MPIDSQPLKNLAEEFKQRCPALLREELDKPEEQGKTSKHPRHILFGIFSAEGNAAGLYSRILDRLPLSAETESEKAALQPIADALLEADQDKTIAVMQSLVNVSKELGNTTTIQQVMDSCAFHIGEAGTYFKTSTGKCFNELGETIAPSDAATSVKSAAAALSEKDVNPCDLSQALFVRLATSISGLMSKPENLDNNQKAILITSKVFNTIGKQWRPGNEDIGKIINDQTEEINELFPEEDDDSATTRTDDIAWSSEDDDYTQASQQPPSSGSRRRPSTLATVLGRGINWVKDIVRGPNKPKLPEVPPQYMSPPTLTDDKPRLKLGDTAETQQVGLEIDLTQLPPSIFRSPVSIWIFPAFIILGVGKDVLGLVNNRYFSPVIAEAVPPQYSSTTTLTDDTPRLGLPGDTAKPQQVDLKIDLTQLPSSIFRSPVSREAWISIFPACIMLGAGKDVLGLVNNPYFSRVFAAAVPPQYNSSPRLSDGIEWLPEDDNCSGLKTGDDTATVTSEEDSMSPATPPPSSYWDTICFNIPLPIVRLVNEISYGERVIPNLVNLVVVPLLVIAAAAVVTALHLTPVGLAASIGITSAILISNGIAYARPLDDRNFYGHKGRSGTNSKLGILYGNHQKANQGPRFFSRYHTAELEKARRFRAESATSEQQGVSSKTSSAPPSNAPGVT